MLKLYAKTFLPDPNEHEIMWQSSKRRLDETCPNACEILHCACAGGIRGSLPTIPDSAAPHPVYVCC